MIIFPFLTDMHTPRKEMNISARWALNIQSVDGQWGLLLQERVAPVLESILIKTIKSYFWHPDPAH